MNAQQIMEARSLAEFPIVAASWPSGELKEVELWFAKEVYRGADMATLYVVGRYDVPVHEGYPHDQEDFLSAQDAVDRALERAGWGRSVATAYLDGRRHQKTMPVSGWLVKEHVRQAKAAGDRENRAYWLGSLREARS